MLYIAIGDGLANIVQVIGLYQVVLKLETSQIIGLFFWQWGMASTIGGLMGYSFYRAVRRAGVFE
ncbi:MAG: hypothetical protein ACRDJ2_16155, partial [Actinomycetota bacterium]